MKCSLAPWITLARTPDGLLCRSRVSASDEYEIPLHLPQSLADQIDLAKPVFYWDKWIQQADSESDILLLKHTWSFFERNQLLLTEISDAVWISPKLYTSPAVDSGPWQGWQNNIAILADRHRGWWLEVPGASHSIWSPNLERLQQLIDVTSVEEKSSLAKLGFDGRYIPADMRSASNTQDWLWLESTRRVSWSGVEGRQNPFAIHSPIIPKGDNVHNLMGKASARTQRMSIRGHQNRARITAQELIDVLTSVFQVTSLHSSAYYGERPKLHGPSGGGGYESEAWVWAREVEGLASGLYRFDGQNAGLEKYPLKPSLLLNWDHRAARDWGRDFGKPQAIIAVVSDLTILLKKYQRLALHVAMLNAGIRLSECLNAAEEKGLAVCALGGGVMKDIAVNWEGNPNLFVPFAEFAIGGRVPQRMETSS